jgi:hypothetical protein
MGYAERRTTTVTTAADGSATEYSDQITGELHALHYVKNNYDNTVDFTVTVESTGEVVWQESNVTASKKVYPVVPANIGSTGAASALTEKPFVLANDRLKFVLVQGGDTKSGAFRSIVK